MVGPSKILTVSYGTFSCTLEGFDEPFTTMKAIAEYFRDLAADDRYFGAEPPTPDAEMLQRIAEREIQRRVETKISEMGVVLRQAGPDATVTPLATAPAAPVAPAPAATAPIAPTLVAHAAPMAEAAPTVAKDLPAAAAPAPVAAVGVPKAADAAQEAQTHRPEVVTDEAYEAALDDMMDEAAAGDVTDVAVLDETAFAESSAAEPATGEDSIAAKLMRIRAVVEGAHRHAKSAFETDDETDASTLSAEPLAADFGFEIDMGKDMPELHAAEAERAALRATTGAEPAALDDIADMSDDLDFDDEPTLAAEPDDSVTLAAAFSDADESAEADDALMAQLSSLRAAVAEHHAAEHRASEAAAEPAPEAPYADLAEAGDAEEAMLEPSEPDFAPRPSLFERARARVLRMGKAATDKDAEAAVAEPEIEPVSDFAEVDADDAFVVADKTQDALALGAETDADLSRLMEEARTKLEGAENRRRFSAISHLKAAVAATLADRKFAAPDTPTQPEIEKAEELSLYREDLSKVVRPRRPAGDALHATPRPDVRPAPLVLVSEQRIDRPGAGAVDAAAIRPRRMAATNLAMFTDDAEDDAFDEADLSPESASSFADFAERIGATSLTELLEAAAAYTASVEGHSHFSRPQILRKVEFVSSRGGYNREDGLRSFGMLLRQGKIQKVSPGQFTLADGSKFTEEARRAAH